MNDLLKHALRALVYNGDYGVGDPNAVGGVYVLVDEEGEIVYVGKAGTFSTRRSQHAKTYGAQYRMMIIAKTNDASLQAGIEDIMYDIFKMNGHQLKHNSERPLGLGGKRDTAEQRQEKLERSKYLRTVSFKYLFDKGFHVQPAAPNARGVQIRSGGGNKPLL